MLKLLILLLTVATFDGSAQVNEYKGLPSLVWPKLYDIKYTKAVDASGEYDKPVFSAAAKSLAGRKISLPGYMVPFDNGMKSKHFILSSLPLNACFFCGVGGPESVIEVHTVNEVEYTEAPVEIQGILRLNSTNPDQMIYVLEKAEVLGEAGF